MKEEKHLHIGIATDIYGIGESIERLASTLGLDGAEVSVVSPYENGAFPPGSGSEQEIYAAFIEYCGHERYSEKILAVLQKERWNCAVGFSAGASAIWRTLAGHPHISLQHFLGFYPTRIRKHLDRLPGGPVTLVFPCFEEVVDVDALIREICGREDIFCLKVPYLHGFLNPLSKNFSIDGQRVLAGLLGSPESIGSPSRCRKMMKMLLQSHER